MAIRAELDLIFKAAQTATGPLSAEKSVGLLVSLQKALGAGTSANQADLVYASAAAATISSGTPLDVDLNSLTDAFGSAIAFVEVCRFIVVNSSTTAGQTLTVGNAASNAWTGWSGGATHTSIIGPEGALFWWSPSDGGAVSGSNKVLRIVASAANIPYKLLIVGRSA